MDYSSAKARLVDGMITEPLSLKLEMAHSMNVLENLLRKTLALGLQI